VGVGSKFHFTARFRQASAAVPGPPDVGLVPGRRVLVVDDNATNRLILDEMLRNWDLKPMTVSSGVEALHALREAREDNRPFDLIVTDCHMPDMDGFALTEEIRQDPQLNKTAMLMLTSGSQP
jgi:CheY-like chemotaxis protein